jgi:hypothetical protein
MLGSNTNQASSANGSGGQSGSKRRTALENGGLTAKNLLLMVDSQNHTCPLSGRTLTPETASPDHIVPVRRGGKHDIVNIQIVDSAINKAKGTMLNSEFIAMCCEVADWSRREIK